MPDVCPPKNAKKLDNWFRRIIHSPKGLFGRYVKKGFVVVDFGCGPGTFVPAMSKMVGPKGKVIAVDLQKGMLEMARQKILNLMLKNVELVKCTKSSVKIGKKADFLLLAYVVHEVPDQKILFKQLHDSANSSAKMLVFEPSWHVSRNNFEKTIKTAEKQGFRLIERPKILLSRGALFSK